MQISSFFEHIQKTKNFPEEKVFCFLGDNATSYPLLFFYYLFTFCKRIGLVIERISCADLDVSEIKALVETIGFSGNSIYWLENFYLLPEKKQQEIVRYLSGYTGPHRLLLFAEKAILSVKQPYDDMCVITLPDKIMLQDFSLVRFLVSDQLPEMSHFASQLCMYSDYLTLDSMCLLAHYELVMGKNSDDFFSQWITRIIDPTRSLFVLSQYFFANKVQSFFRQWSTLSEHYAPVFWVTFWSDQIWRAYVYCDLMKQKKYAEAKKAQYKLPFSFINRDWTNYDLDELRNTHHFLTKMDFRLKNGGSALAFEHFYNQFFSRKFH